MTRSERRHAIAAAIRETMKEHNLTQAALAEIFDIDKSTMSRRYRGDLTWPAEDLFILADMIGAPIPIGTPALPAGRG